MSQASTNPYLHHLERSVILPLVLLLNFGIFQYLVLLYHNKARQPYVCLLLIVSALSVALLVPFATQSQETLGTMNDASESCLALMLLVQTAFALKHAESTNLFDQASSSTKVVSGNVKAWCRYKLDTSHSQRRRACLGVLKSMHVVADLLILLDCGFVVFEMVAIFRPSILDDFGGADDFSNGLEITTLAFTLFYRFLALALNKGSFRVMLNEVGLELAAHVGFALHEYPFLIAENTSGVSWEMLQMIFMRIALVPCVWMTIGEHHYRRPTHKQLTRLSRAELQELIHRASTVVEVKSQSRSNSLTNRKPTPTHVNEDTNDRLHQYDEARKESFAAHLGLDTTTEQSNT